MATDAYRFGNDSDAEDTSNATTYDWYDGAVIASQTFDRDANSITNILLHREG